MVDIKKSAAPRGGGRPFVKNDPRINRRGRPKGSRDKMSDALVDAFLADWMVHGKESIERVREKDPSTYVRVAFAMMPKEIKQEVEVLDTTDHASEIEWDVITGKVA
jgi:hypothetical protein